MHGSSIGLNESNFVTVGATGAANVLVTQEKSPYAVTLHNVDKFELLTKVNARKSMINDDKYEGVVPSEEYMSNLRQSFDFVDVPQSKFIPNNKRTIANPKKEDNSILYAKMQNTRLWQLSSQFKSLQKVTVSSVADMENALSRSAQNFANSSHRFL